MNTLKNIKGEQIKAIKAIKSPNAKEEIAPLVEELLNLKRSYKDLSGSDYGPPPKEKEKKTTDSVG